MRRNVLFFSTLLFIASILLSPKAAVAVVDPNFYLWPECKDVTGHQAQIPSLDGCPTTNVCGTDQCRDCRIQILPGQNWWDVLTNPQAAVYRALFERFSSVPAYTCSVAAASAPFNSVVSTEVGKIDADPNSLILTFTRIFSGIGGGASLLLLLSGAAGYLTSSGNPEAIAEAQQTIVHALGGLFLVFLSIFLFRFIGVDVLGIPGLSPSGGGVTVPGP